MKCPKCGYMNGWDAEGMKAIDVAHVFGCPSCLETFIQIKGEY